MKTLFMTTLFVFIVGSVLSAAAPTSTSFIIGRALSGLGAAGVFSGMTIIIANITSLKYRPIYLAITGGVETCALALGPLISGAIAHSSTWRVSFYIIIPFGCAVLVAVFLSVDHIRRPEYANKSHRDRLKRIDRAGFAISIPATMCFVMALQWGGTIYPWGSWRIVLLLVLAAVLFLVWLVVEHKAGENGMISLTMLRQRTVAAATLITLCNFAHLCLLAYYLPFYFQAVRGASTLQSGLMYLPTAIALGISVTVGGPLTTLIGYPNPVLLFGSSVMVIGAGLITTIGVDDGPGKWISFQVIYGIGIGLSFQPQYVAVQSILVDSLVPVAIVILGFAQQLGGIVVLSIAQNVFLNRLAHNLATEIPGVKPNVLNNGVLGIIDDIPASLRTEALVAYNEALRQVFYIALGLTCVAVVSVLAIEWKSIRHGEGEKGVSTEKDATIEKCTATEK